MIRAYHRAFSGLPARVWILALVLLINRAGSMVMPFLALYVSKVMHYGDEYAALVMAFYGVGSLLGNYAGGWLTERIGAFRVQFWSLLLNAAGFILLSTMRGYAPFAITLVGVSFVAEVFRPANATAVTSAALRRPCDVGLR